MRAMRLNNGLSLFWLALALILTPTLSLQMHKRNTVPECSNVSAVTVAIQFGLLASGSLTWVRLTALNMVRWMPSESSAVSPSGLISVLSHYPERRES